MEQVSVKGKAAKAGKSLPWFSESSKIPRDPHKPPFYPALGLGLIREVLVPTPQGEGRLTFVTWSRLMGGSPGKRIAPYCRQLCVPTLSREKTSALFLNRESSLWVPDLTPIFGWPYISHFSSLGFVYSILTLEYNRMISNNCHCQADAGIQNSGAREGGTISKPGTSPGQSDINKRVIPSIVLATTKTHPVGDTSDCDLIWRKDLCRSLLY